MGMVNYAIALTQFTKVALKKWDDYQSRIPWFVMAGFRACYWKHSWSYGYFESEASFDIRDDSVFASTIENSSRDIDSTIPFDGKFSLMTELQMFA
jgi:hypothetical protein